MRDSAEVEKILVAAGKSSYSESMYEAGPQSVTQVPHSCQSLTLENISLPGVHRFEHRQDKHHPDHLPGDLHPLAILGCSKGLPDYENR